MSWLKAERKWENPSHSLWTGRGFSNFKEGELEMAVGANKVIGLALEI